MKAILLVRVSTERQNFDIQEEEIYELALAAGFKDEEIIPIAEKESGAKLKENERRGLKRMKEVIEKGDISSVFVWEVSRLARSVTVGSSILDYLIEKKTQLVVKAPSLKLLNNDGTPNSANKMIMIFLLAFAEEENRIRKLRTDRTKKVNAEKGKWNGGRLDNVMYGYKIGENNYYVIDEKEADIVKTIYNLYAETDMGQEAIRKELLSRGIKVSQDRIRRILSRSAYTGEPYVSKVWDKEKKIYKSGYTIQLPPIIDKELYNKVIKKKEKVNSTCIRKDSYYFAKNLLKCPVCGHAFIGYKSAKNYMCVAYKHDNKDIEKCNNNNCININVLDTILWEDAKREYAAFLANEKEQSIQNIKESIETINKKLDVCINILPTIDKKYNRLSESYIMGDISAKVRNEIKNKIDKEKSDCINNIGNYQSQITQLESRLSYINDRDRSDRFSFFLNWNDFIEEIDNNSHNIQEMYEIIHKFISRVEFERLEGHKKCYWKVTVFHPMAINPLTGVMEEEYNIYIGYCREDKYKYWVIPSKFYGTTEDDFMKGGYFQYEIYPQQILRQLGRGKK